MTIEVEEAGELRVIRLARPPVNAISRQLVHDLTVTADALDAEPACAGIVLTGLPGAFSAGFDLKEAAAMTADEREGLFREINRLVLALYRLSKPLVAAVGGHAFGGGLILAMTADLRYAARGDFRIGLTEAAAGVRFPAGLLAALCVEAGPETVRPLVLGSEPEPIDSPLAARVFDRYLDPVTLVEESLVAAGRMAAHPSHGEVKRQLRASAIERLERIAAQ